MRVSSHPSLAPHYSLSIVSAEFHRMNSSGPNHHADIQLAEDCLAGKADAWESLRTRLQGPLLATLIGRGASPTEAEDVLADLWSDTILKGGERGLLERYDGSYSLKCWFSCIATNRLVDLKRRQRFVGEIPTSAAGDEPNSFDTLPSPRNATPDSALLHLMRDSLRAALRELEPETRLFLRLAYLEGVTQREIAAVFDMDESKISRQLRAAMEHVGERTLTIVRARDPYLTLNWEDFLELCSGSVDALFC